MPERRGHYLALADEVLALCDQLAGAATAEMQRGEQFDTRGRVITGLALKIESSFRALMADAREGRSEAMHHLKTVVESYLYFELVAMDATDVTARRFLAEACARKLRSMEQSKAYAEALLDPWRAAVRVFEDEGIRPLGGNLGRLTKDVPSLAAWYALVYGLACDPAHIGDVFEFMPAPGATTIARTGSQLRDLQANVALERGLFTMLALFEGLVQLTSLIDHAVIDNLRARVAAVGGAPA